MKAIFEKSKCINCGSCAAVCPKYFELDKDNKIYLKGSKMDSKGNECLEIEKKDCIQETIDICPMKCIHIEK